MSEPIPREAIAKQADQAAQLYARTGQMKPNPFQPGTDQWKWFKVDFERYYEIHTAPHDVEGGA